MPQLYTLFDADLFTQMVEQRYVKSQKHPHADLRIYNYTQLAQFDRIWNPVTLACRGLIVDSDDYIVARPFAKFFNLADHPGDTLPDSEVHVTEKLDGSLGILYPTSDGYSLATRGSFTSEQAVHATNVWRLRYAHRFAPHEGWTYLYEIVYPSNRIVVDYSDIDDLFLLGAVETSTGRSVSYEQAIQGWPGPVAQVHFASTLGDALALPVRENSEGLVIHFTDQDLRVKLKHAEYVRLHRIVTGLSDRRIWEALAAGDDLGPWLEAVPDEFFDYVTSTRDRFLSEHAAGLAAIETAYNNLLESLPLDWVRRDFAAKVAAMTDFPFARGLFSRLDGRDCSDMVWQSLRPAEHRPLWGQNEDVS